MQPTGIQPIPVGYAPIIAAIIDRMGWVKRINDMVPATKNPCKLSHGLRNKALIINILTQRQALYRVETFYEKQDLELLFGEAIDPHDLNDDALGRTLDAFHQAGLDSIYHALALSVLEMGGVTLEALLFDTSSFSFYGAYEGEGSLAIVRGYSKDRRPDRNQIHFGMGTANGIPVVADVYDGNRSDTVWNREILQKVKELFDPDRLKRMIYVSDSALVNEENLADIHRHGLSFISTVWPMS